MIRLCIVLQRDIRGVVYDLFRKTPWSTFISIKNALTKRKDYFFLTLLANCQEDVVMLVIVFVLTVFGVFERDLLLFCARSPTLTSSKTKVTLTPSNNSFSPLAVLVLLGGALTPCNNSLVPLAVLVLLRGAVLVLLQVLAAPSFFAKFAYFIAVNQDIINFTEKILKLQ